MGKQSDAIGGALAFGAGAVGLDSLFGGQDEAEQRLEYIKSLFSKQAGRINAGYGQAIDLGQQALQTIRAGYGAAGDELSRVGASARYDAMARGQVQAGRAKQEAISRGVYGTSAYDAARGSITSQTERDLGAIDSQLAGLRSGLMVSGANATANAMNQLGGKYMQFSDARGVNIAQLAQILQGVQDGGSNPVSDMIGYGGQFASIAALLA